MRRTAEQRHGWPGGEPAGRSRWRGALAPACALAAVLTLFAGVSAASGTASPGPQAASPSPSSAVTLQATYTCAVPVLGNTAFSATVTASAPASVAPGGKVTVTGYQASLSLPAGLVDDLLSLGATSPLTGSLTVEDLNATNATPQSLNAATTPLPVSVSLVQGQPAPVEPQPVTVGPFTAANSGTIDFTPGAITFSGQFPVIGQASLPCTLTTSPAPVLASTAITQPATQLSVATTSLPAGTAGLSYSATLTAEGGTPPYRWMLEPGTTLPAGLSLDTSNGTISGIPTTQGTTAFAVEVSDSSVPSQSAVSPQLSIDVGPPVPMPTALSWGRNGLLGEVSTTESHVPVPVAMPPGIALTGVAAGYDFSVATTSAGAVYAWGDNTAGQLGNGSTGTSASPVQVQLPAGVEATSVSAGGFYVLALASDGSVYAWGDNVQGQLGDGSTASSDVPTKVQLPAGVEATSVSAGGAHSLATTSAGAVYAWGNNAQGQLGDGSTASSETPRRVGLPPSARATTVSAGAAHSLALTAGGAVFAWGYNADGQLGTVPRSHENRLEPTPVHLPTRSRVTRVLAGEYHSLALTADGRVYAWGDNQYGQLGDASTLNFPFPRPARLPSGSKAVSIGSGPLAVSSLALTLAAQR